MTNKKVTVTRQALSMHVQKNWRAQKQNTTETGSSLDDSLTNLDWLQRLNFLSALNGPETECQSSKSTNDSKKQVNPNSVLNMTGGTGSNLSSWQDHPSNSTSNGIISYHRNSVFNSSRTIDVSSYKSGFTSYQGLAEFKSNPTTKPPYSYSSLICMAIKASKSKKLTLSGIYSYIMENFPYFRTADISWRNSVRHNLSMSKCFEKVPRNHNEPGKGGFWRINPKEEDSFVDGIFKKRRNYYETFPLYQPAPKKIKMEPADEDRTAALMLTRELSYSESTSSSSSSSDDAIYDETDIISNENVIKADFNWNTLCHQEMSSGGRKIKTEPLIGECEEDTDESSAPMSIASSSDISDYNDVETVLEDFLNSADYNQPLDLTSNSGLDMTITGNWLAESFNQNASGEDSFMGFDNIASDEAACTSHPWADDTHAVDNAVSSFELDLQDIFENHNPWG